MAIYTLKKETYTKKQANELRHVINNRLAVIKARARMIKGDKNADIIADQVDMIAEFLSGLIVEGHSEDDQKLKEQLEQAINLAS